MEDAENNLKIISNIEAFFVRFLLDNHSFRLNTAEASTPLHSIVTFIVSWIIINQMSTFHYQSGMYKWETQQALNKF